MCKLRGLNDVTIQNEDEEIHRDFHLIIVAKELVTDLKNSKVSD